MYTNLQKNVKDRERKGFQIDLQPTSNNMFWQELINSKKLKIELSNLS